MTDLYNALLLSSSSGGFGGARYPSSVYICSSFAARPALLTVRFSDVTLPPGSLGSCVGDVIGRGDDDWRVRHTRRGRAGTVKLPSSVEEIGDIKSAAACFKVIELATFSAGFA
jgi:hypothetical protein